MLPSTARLPGCREGLADLLETASNEEETEESERLNDEYGKLVDDGAVGESFRKLLSMNRELYAP